MSKNDRTKIKICGIRTEAEANFLNEAGVNYAGCVFFDKSKRNVSYGQAEAVLKALDDNITRVAVTVSPDVTKAKELEALGFDILQVHKQLSADVVKAVNIPIWYACNISDPGKLDEALGFMDSLPDEAKDKIKGIVMDAPDYGSGVTFDWENGRAGEIARKIAAREIGLIKDKELILAGGLNDNNVKTGLDIFKPDTVDVSSSVENETGKDRDKILSFVRTVREHTMSRSRW